MDNTEKDHALREKLEELGRRIRLMRNLAILFSLLVLVFMVPAVVIQNVLPSTLKVWLLGVLVITFVALLVALFLCRNDSTATLFVTALLISVTGVILGVLLCSLQKIITGQH